MVDHNNGDFVVWESKAILLYLVETYDKSGSLTVTDPKQRALLYQYLFFQASGQGVSAVMVIRALIADALSAQPYFGQEAHFKIFAPEKIQYAIDRYAKEVARVLGVLEDILSKSSSGWLVGDKVTIADLSFVTW